MATASKNISGIGKIRPMKAWQIAHGATQVRYQLMVGT